MKRMNAKFRNLKLFKADVFHVVLNLFQHLTRQADLHRSTLHERCRNKFGMMLRVDSPDYATLVDLSMSSTQRGEKLKSNSLFVACDREGDRAKQDRVSYRRMHWRFDSPDYDSLVDLSMPAAQRGEKNLFNFKFIPTSHNFVRLTS
jgi:hypothetical protein